MEIHLPEDLRRFVAEEVAAGRYDSQLEVLEAALLQMKERAERLRALRRRFMEEDVDQNLEISH